MRWIVLVLLGGCASTQALEHATAQAQACEYRHEQVQADAKRLRTESLASDDDRRAANAQAWADKIEIDCRLWRDQVAIEQARVEASRANRQRAAAALHGMAEAHRGAASAYETTTSCTSVVSGNVVNTTCR